MDYKFTTTFSSTIKPLVSEEKDKYLAMASLIDIGDLIPDIDTEKNVDLLPVAFNACVANRANKNGDVIDSKTALAIFENFINKPINVEHNRHNVVGTILTAGFSEFGTDKILEAEEVKNSDAPFNIVLGGVIWRIVDSHIADFIEESSDPTSEDYMKISASWELGFSCFQIAVLEEDKKNLEDAKFISNVEEIAEIQSNLKAFGGNGKLEDGRSVFRHVVGNVIPLGIGLTENPAADVKGIATEETTEETTEDGQNLESEKKYQNSEKKLENSAVIDHNTKESISQKNKNNVIDSKETNMNIESIKDITDETPASVVSDFIETELKKASEKFLGEKREVEKDLEEAKSERDSIAEEHSAIKTKIEEVKVELESYRTEKVERERLETFNQRMASLDEKFVLSDEEREIIADDVRNLGDEDWENAQKKLSVLLRDKNREILAENAKTEEKEEEEVKASESETVVEEAVDSADKDKNHVPTSIIAEEETLQNKYKDAFSIDNFNIKL